LQDGVLRTKVRYVVGEEIGARERAEGCALLRTLLAFQNQARVHLATRLIDAGNSGDEELGADGPNVILWRDAKVDREPVVDSPDAVPFGRVEVVADWMEGMLPGDSIYRLPRDFLVNLDTLMLEPRGG